MTATDETSPWHAGEQALQQEAGVLARMDAVGRHVIRDYMTEQHRSFYAQLPFVVLGTVDRAGNVWATIRTGRPGFLTAADPRHLNIALPRDPADPADAGLEDGDGIGLLGIEPHTRRRNRLNGVVRRTSPDGFTIETAQSFGNCPRYIHPRQLAFVTDSAAAPVPCSSLSGRAAEIVRQADTFFVASYVRGDDGRAQPDVSHRGGPEGFVRIDADGSLTIPDFAGNRFFATLGNMLVNPKAGLVFVDFTTGDLLQMTGAATILPDRPQSGDVERMWRFHPQRILYRPQALPLRWQDQDSQAA